MVLSAAKRQDLLGEVRAMEGREGLTRLEFSDAMIHRWVGARMRTGFTTLPIVSPDGSALCWGMETVPDPGPFLTVSSEARGLQNVFLKDYTADAFVVSSGPAWIVTTARRPLPVRNSWRLLLVDLRSGINTIEAPAPIPVWEPRSISGTGALVAVCDGITTAVHEIPSGHPVHRFAGIHPLISPDGTSIAYIRNERFMSRPMDGDTERVLLPSVKAVSNVGWSPNGRYLLAAAWTRRVAFYKRLIVIDVESGDYAELHTLGDGDHARGETWVSQKLLAR